MLGDLLSPAGPDFMKDFPAQNAINCDRIDSYAGPCLTSDSLQVWTPGLDGTSGTPNLGTGGFTRGHYYQIMDQIYMWGEFRFGTSGIDVGGGIYFINLPFEVKTIMGISSGFNSSPIVGTATLYDDSSNAGRLPLTVHLKTSTQIQFGIRINAGSANRELRSAGYITWAVEDGLAWNARFQRIS